jgi:hypothetical protein
MVFQLYMHGAPYDIGRFEQGLMKIQDEPRPRYGLVEGGPPEAIAGLSLGIHRYWLTLSAPLPGLVGLSTKVSNFFAYRLEALSLILGGKFINKGIKIAIKNRGKIMRGQPDAMICYTRLREVIGPDLF